MKTTQNGGTTARTRDAAPAPKQQDSKEVAKATQGQVPDYLREQMKADAGKGVSESKDDSLVPLIVVLQGQSPQVMKPKAEYIPGAEAGDLWVRNGNPPIVKNEQGGLLVQPCYFYKTVGEWIPRNPDGSGGGFIATHEWVEGWEKSMGLKEVEDDKGGKRWMDQDEEHEFIEARNHVVIIYPEGGNLAPYLIPFSGSGHSVSREWTFMMKNKTTDGKRDPSFAHLYRLKTIMRTKGNMNWYVIKPEEGNKDGTSAWATLEQYNAGKELHEAFASGAKKADMAGAAPETAAPAAGNTAQDAKAAETI